MIYKTARPYITKKEERYVRKALRSGVLSIGPYIEKFEKKFARRCGTKYACAVSSGTAGLHLALISAGVKAGDEVITSPYSFIASANAILYVGATPVFVDIDPKTYNMDGTKLERAITKKTKAILPVHIFGQMADMAPVMTLAKKHKLAVIEDACESLLAEQKGKKAGTFGKTGIFAFYANKQMTTGEGGMIITNDKKIDELCRSLRNQGRTPNRNWLDHSYLGFNYRMNEMSAALGLAQIEKIDFLIKKRREVAALYENALRPLARVIALPYTAPGNTHTWFVYVIRLLNPRISRDKVLEDLARRGVYGKPYLPSIHLFEFYRKRFGFKRGDYPVSERVSKSTFALPFYIGLTKKDTARIASIVKNVITHHEKNS